MRLMTPTSAPRRSPFVVSIKRFFQVLSAAGALLLLPAIVQAQGLDGQPENFSSFHLRTAISASKSKSTVSGPEWRRLAPLPMAIAGQCVGTAGGKLIVAGGSTWSAAPWNGGVKRWSAAIESLRAMNAHWKSEGTLPQAMAYGASAQWGDSLLCVGGQDGTHAFASVLRLHVRGGRLRVDALPPLPHPLTNAAAAVVGDTLFVIGGQRDLTPGSVSDAVWSLPLRNNARDARWKKEPAPWKNARILPVVTECSGSLFVMSGAELSLGPNNSPVRTYLKDAWKRDSSGNWVRLPNLAAAVVAAPSACDAHGDPLVFGGDDGALAAQISTLRDRHPGFTRTVHRLDAKTGAWTAVSELPLSLVTTSATKWKGLYVIAGGENRPGHRSATVVAQPIAR